MLIRSFLFLVLLSAAALAANPAEAAAKDALGKARRAVAAQPQTAQAHLDLAVAYGKMTDFVGNQTKVEYSKLIKDETSRAIALDPTNDFAWHVLGRWHSGVANVNAVLRTLARAVYGGIPPASNDEAVRCLQKAAELAPRRIIHHSELARVHQLMEKPQLAAKEWRAVLALPAVDEEDVKDQREAKRVLRLR